MTLNNFLHNFKCLINGDLENIIITDRDVCKCGILLPKVKDNETPFEYCSEACKDYFRDR